MNEIEPGNYSEGRSRDYPSYKLTNNLKVLATQLTRRGGLLVSRKGLPVILLSQERKNPRRASPFPFQVRRNFEKENSGAKILTISNERLMVRFSKKLNYLKIGFLAMRGSDWKLALAKEKGLSKQDFTKGED